MTNQIDQIKKFFHLLEQFESNEKEYLAILHPGIVQVEYPNHFIQETRQRTFADLMSAAETGRKMLTYQRFEQANYIEINDSVVAEYKWTGELKVKAGKLKKGHVLKAHICTIFEFKDGKIFRQRNYDCYEPG